jgi:hypothetical protein
MAAILKFKMAVARGRFLSGTRPEMNRHTIKYLCAKFGAFIPIRFALFCSFLTLIGWTMWLCESWSD